MDAAASCMDPAAFQGGLFYTVGHVCLSEVREMEAKGDDPNFTPERVNERRDEESSLPEMKHRRWLGARRTLGAVVLSDAVTPAMRSPRLPLNPGLMLTSPQGALLRFGRIMALATSPQPACFPPLAELV